MNNNDNNFMSSNISFDNNNKNDFMKSNIPFDNNNSLLANINSLIRTKIQIIYLIVQIIQI